MKEPRDLTRSWIQKAESDLAACALSLGAGQALDAACFHAQQAAEKYLKAYLICKDIEFPFVHNLEKLVELCSEGDTAFQELLETAAALTPYAVELRYADDFWPSPDTAAAAHKMALRVKDFVLARLPAADGTGSG
ncbi:MAG: HEPN domain-containing protein [Planctomycetota bacterium]